MRVLLINSVCGKGSTGRICTDIADCLISKGHEVKIAYGRDKAPKKYEKYSYKIGNNMDNMVHILSNRILDNQGFSSKLVTKKFIKWIKEYNPDVIHLHNLHGYYLNIEILFKYLQVSNAKIVWTLHDCWPFTGHCSHYSLIGCNQWQRDCSKCMQKSSYPKSVVLSDSKNNFKKKKELFCGLKNIVIVTPSFWMKQQVELSFLNKYPIKVIPNGIDLEVFRPTKSDLKEKLGVKNKIIILGAATAWSKAKGFDIFVNLSKQLSEEYQIIMIGLSKKLIKKIPKSIIGISRTNDSKEMAQYYSIADVFLNPSLQETMGLTTVEAMACGTPVIVSNKTAVPEVVSHKTGIVLKSLDVKEIVEELKRINEFKAENLLNHTLQYDKISKYDEYISLYMND